MGNVANLELSRELYELSGWETEKLYWQDNRSEKYIPELRKLTLLEYKPLWLHKEDNADNHVVPAYDLGFLLRKLPSGLFVYKGENQYKASWLKEYAVTYTSGACDTPENAVAKLCIELFKQNILTKES